ncbi:hypothetical protein K8353_42370, partial [Burkholderia contaminans]|nr:hypothetical protein [Burkholderia contaminans]
KFRLPNFYFCLPPLISFAQPLFLLGLNFVQQVGYTMSFLVYFAECLCGKFEIPYRDKPDAFHTRALAIGSRLVLTSCLDLLDKEVKLSIALHSAMYALGCRLLYRKK